MSTNRFRIGIVGARGHVGAELIRLLAGHPGFELAFVSSRALDGERVADHNPAYSGELRYTSPGYDQLPELGADAVVLALPNGKAARCVEAFDRAGSDALLIDLSADYRFDPAWYYGLPELTRGRYAGQRRINAFYQAEADGFLRQEEWKVFWYGIEDLAAVGHCVAHCAQRPATLLGAARGGNA